MLRKTNSNNPADWLFYAASDLEGVVELVGREISHPLCRAKLAEILEKIIKAELIRLGWRLEKIHELNRLALALETYGSPSKAEAAALCAKLADFYFTDRYPGFDLDDPDWPVLRSQVEQVAALLAAVQARIPTPRPPAA